MARFRRLGAAIAIAAWGVAFPSLGGDVDEEGIRQAVLDYAESAYLVRPDLVERSVHPKLQKLGYVMREGDEGYRELWMNFYELRELVAGWNEGNRRFDPATARREIVVLDRLDQTAVARLDAEWGIDFFQLAKIDGKWTIINVIWQSYPPDAAAQAVLGSWEMTTEFQGQEIPAVMVLSFRNGRLTGVWKTQGQDLHMMEVEFDGETLRFDRIMGRSGAWLRYEGVVEGDALSGAYTAQDGQTLPCSGTRKRDP